MMPYSDLEPAHTQTEEDNSIYSLIDTVLDNAPHLIHEHIYEIAFSDECPTTNDVLRAIFVSYQELIDWFEQLLESYINYEDIVSDPDFNEADVNEFLKNDNLFGYFSACMALASLDENMLNFVMDAIPNSKRETNTLKRYALEAPEFVKDAFVP